MDALYNLLSRLKPSPVARDERGVTAIEYALIGVLIGLAIIGSITTFGTNLTAKFTLVDIALAGVAVK